MGDNPFHARRPLAQSREKATGMGTVSASRISTNLGKLAAAALLLPLLLCGLAHGGEAAPAAADPQLEQRVTALAEELRCLVCQNQSLADSHADLAVDLRNQIREKFRSGMSERQVIDFMVERYGDFVLYRPPLKPTTLLLWFGPLLLIVIGLVVLVRRVRRTAGASVELSADDRERAAQLLGGDHERTARLPGGEAANDR